MVKRPINKVARHYSDCMTPDQTWRRCRPGARAPTPEDEARKRNDELLEASGEEVTLLTRRIRGDDIVDRQIGPPQNNYVSALPLNMIFTFINGGFSDNLSAFLSDPKFSDLKKGLRNNSPPVGVKDIKAIIVATRPLAGETNYIYAGNRLQFSNLSVKLLTRLKSDNVIWEYSRGNGIWFPIPVNPIESTPQVTTLQQSGRMVFDVSFFANWQQDYVNGEKAFWVRAKIDESTEGEASAILLFHEHFIQSVNLWNVGDDPKFFPNDRCVTITVDGKIFNRVYDIHQLDYSAESFVLIRRDQLTADCPLNDNQNDQCGLNPFDTCETDPLDHIKEIGSASLPETIRLRELAFLYNQISRWKPKGAADAVVLLFTRNLRLDGKALAATYTNMCPCTAYGRFQTFRDSKLPDDSICNACFGIEFLHGYDRFINPEATNGKILMSFPAAPFDMPLEEHGMGKTQELTTARMSWTPKIFVRDIVVRYNEFGEETGRYIVMTRTDSIGRRGVLLHQEMVLSLLDPDKAEYRIAVPDLPLAASQAEVLLSLGFIQDVPTLSSCDEKRLEKGVKDCRPVRKKVQE